MFLDEELNKIYKDGSRNCTVNVCVNLINACVARIKKDSTSNFINSIKQIDSSFRIFAKQTNNINENGFKSYISNIIKEDEKADKIFNLLNWNKNE